MGSKYLEEGEFDNTPHNMYDSYGEWLGYPNKSKDCKKAKQNEKAKQKIKPISCNSMLQ